MALARVFIALAAEKPVQRISKGIIFEKAADYAPRPSDPDYKRRNDVPWLDRFAAAGGRAIISGDVKMRQRTHERLALYEHGFVVIFFDPQWAEWDFFKKSSLLIHWWQIIMHKIQCADTGTFWAIPCSWPVKNGELRNVSLGLAKLLKDNPNREEKQLRNKKRPSASKSRRDERQRGFIDELIGEPHAAQQGQSRNLMQPK